MCNGEEAHCSAMASQFPLLAGSLHYAIMNPSLLAAQGQASHDSLKGLLSVQGKSGGALDYMSRSIALLARSKIFIGRQASMGQRHRHAKARNRGCLTRDRFRFRTREPEAGLLGAWMDYPMRTMPSTGTSTSVRSRVWGSGVCTVEPSIRFRCDAGARDRG